MVFSTNNLYRQENIIDNAPIPYNVLKVSENTSLFIDSLHYILEENILIENELAKYNILSYNNKKLLYLQEDNVISDILKNGININIKGLNIGEKISNTASNLFQKVKTNLTIENVVKFIITGFIKLIVRIYKEFEIICMNLVSKNSQIKRLNKKINDIGVDVTYKAPMFTYTHTMDDTKRTDLEEQLRDIYDELMKFLNTFKNIQNTRDLDAAMFEFNSSKVYDEDKYSEIRGQLLGSNCYISEEDFNEALFKYFRNNSSTATVDNVITPNNVRERLHNWEKAPSLIRIYQRDRDKLEKAGNSLVDKLNRAKVDNYIKEVSATTLNLYSDLVNRYAHKIKNTCNIFLLFYAQKLDAIKDELALNTKILFNICQYIVREGL